MCGRFTQTKSREEVLETLGSIELPPLFHGRYNVAPTQSVAIIRQNTPSLAETSQWGFQSPQKTAPVINARSETLLERPMFKDLVSHNRCLIFADGFYEWKNKQPHYFQLSNHQLFAFAGLWKQGSCVVLTREADRNMCGIHSRMPLILPKEKMGEWLDHFHIPNSPQLTNRPVSRIANRVSNDSPACLAHAEEQQDLSLFPDED